MPISGRILLKAMNPALAEAVLANADLTRFGVAPSYPTEFTPGSAARAKSASPLGPFCMHRADNDRIVGDIGGAIVEPGVVEIGYAVASGEQGKGYATAAVLALVEKAFAIDGVERLRGHTPLDRPASARVLEKAGFAAVGEVDDEHEGQVLRVMRWELARRPKR